TMGMIVGMLLVSCTLATWTWARLDPFNPSAATATASTTSTPVVKPATPASTLAQLLPTLHGLTIAQRIAAIRQALAAIHARKPPATPTTTPPPTTPPPGTTSRAPVV